MSEIMKQALTDKSARTDVSLQKAVVKNVGIESVWA